MDEHPRFLINETTTSSHTRHLDMKQPPSASAETTTSPPTPTRLRWSFDVVKAVLAELKSQRSIALPLAGMNLTWFAKTTVTTAFLGRLGELELAAGTIGFTFANVTGFSVLTGLSAAMEPLCGQAHGAGNRALLRKTLFMTTLLLLAASIPITLLWLNVDRLLLRFGQQRDIAELAKQYVEHLLPDLAVTSFLCPLKVYLSSQGVTLPTLFSSAAALAVHVPLNLLFSRAKGIEGVAMVIWLTDLAAAAMLASYVGITEWGEGDSSGEAKQGPPWWEQSAAEWGTLLRIAAPCCLTTCLEWWCYEILVLLTGRLPDPRQMVSVIAIVLNFDYLLYSAMLSLATSASTRVSNELGAGRPGNARSSAYVSIGVSVFIGLCGGAAMVGARGGWGRLFSHEKGIVEGAKKMMLVMAGVEVMNFPVATCGGVVRGTARPCLAMYASLGGFYLVALPLAVAMGFTMRLGLCGLILGFLVGAMVTASLLVVFVCRIDWSEEANKAGHLTRKTPDEMNENISV